MLFAAITAMVFVAGAGNTHATDRRPSYFEQSADVILPVGYNRNTRYPVFILLPPTGVHASVVARNFGLDPRRQESFVLVFPAGRPTRAEYLPDFLSFVAEYERRLVTDLADVLDTYAVDSDRIYLGGYSLGGDLSWALSVRNPDLFAGAVIAGSRTSHPVSPSALKRLRERGFRAAFLIGNREEDVRYDGINYARSRFETEGVVHQYREYAGAHTIPPTEMLVSAVRFVTGTEDLPGDEPSRTRPTPVARAPQHRTPAPSGTSPAPLVDHTSRDRLALRAELPAELGTDGLTIPTDTNVSARIEWPWRRAFVRSTVAHRTTLLADGDQSEQVHQDLVVGAGFTSRHLFGVGLGWDWMHRIEGVSALPTFDLLLAHAVRNPWIIPAGRVDPNRLDALLIARYTVPRGVGSGVAMEQWFNLRLEYLLRIADLLVVDVSGGSYTVQNTPVDDIDTLSRSLDHRWEWEVGVGVRAPSPLLWRVGYRGRSERSLPDGGASYRGVGTFTVEFSY